MKIKNHGYTLVELLISLLIISVGILILMGLWNQIFRMNQRYKVVGTLYDFFEYSGSLIWNLQSDNDPVSINQNIVHRLSEAEESFFESQESAFSVSKEGDLELFEVLPNPDGYLTLTPVPID